MIREFSATRNTDYTGGVTAEEESEKCNSGYSTEFHWKKSDFLEGYNSMSD